MKKKLADGDATSIDINKTVESIENLEATLVATRRHLSLADLREVTQLHNKFFGDYGKYRIKVIPTGINLPTPDEISSKLMIVDFTLLGDKPISIRILCFNDPPQNPTISTKLSIRISPSIWSAEFSSLHLIEPGLPRKPITSYGRSDEETINKIRDFIVDWQITDLYASTQIIDPDSNKIIARSLDASSIPGDFREIIKVNH